VEPPNTSRSAHSSDAPGAQETDGGASIRPASPNDVKGVEVLFKASIDAADESRRAALASSRDTTLDLLANATGTPDSADQSAPQVATSWVWVAESPAPAREIAGVAALNRLADHEVELSRVQIHPQHRRKGLASRLIERVMRFCYDQGHLKMVLYTDATDTPANSLFRKSHFHFHRARTEGDRHRLEYYFDLYQRPDVDPQAEG